MKQLPLPAHPVFPSRLDSIAALPELLAQPPNRAAFSSSAMPMPSIANRSCSPCWRTAKSCTQSTPPCHCRTARTAR